MVTPPTVTPGEELAPPVEPVAGAGDEGVLVAAVSALWALIAGRNGFFAVPSTCRLRSRAAGSSSDTIGSVAPWAAAALATGVPPATGAGDLESTIGTATRAATRRRASGQRRRSTSCWKGVTIAFIE